MREVVVRSWCDICYSKEDEKTEGREHVFTIGNGKTKTLTVCLDHESEYVAPFLAVFDEYAIHDPDKAPKRHAAKTTPAANGLMAPLRQDAIACPQCDSSYETRSQLAAHGRRVHGVSLAQLLGEPTPYVCDECGGGFGRAQSLAAHKTRSHG